MPDFEIHEGDSNEVCLAKSMLLVDHLLTFGHATDNPDAFLAVVKEGATYANEVLNARDD